MESLTFDLWSLVAVKLPFYDFIWLSKVCKQWYQYFTEELWLRRLSTELKIPISIELRLLFNSTNNNNGKRFLSTLSYGQKVEKQSKLILAPIDCLGFAIMMRDVPLTKYFTQLKIETSSHINESQINSIDELCCYLNEPDCLLACLQLLKEIEKDEGQFIYNVEVYSLFPKEVREALFKELTRLEIIDPQNIKACELYLKFGFQAYKQMQEINYVYLFGTGSVQEIEQINTTEFSVQMVRCDFIEELFSRKGIIRSQYEHLESAYSLTRGRRGFIPRRGRLWSPNNESIPEVAVKLFPEIYSPQIPTVLHTCYICKHYCFDIQHDCKCINTP